MTLEDLERSSPGDWFYNVRDQLKDHVYRRSERAFAAGDAARDGITTRAALEERQRELRRFFVESLGGLFPMDTPLAPRTVGLVRRGGDGFRIEKVIFESRPRHHVTANLYLPEGGSGPRGAVLFLCGHHRDAKHVAEYQIVCQYLVRAGLVVLAQDPPGQGERLAYHEPGMDPSSVRWGTEEHDHVGAQCLPLGDALARYFLHDAMRGVDYLRSRPEVDPERIGVTGNSGGGTQASLVMLADPRIAAAAPATFIMSRHSYLLSGGAQDAEQVWPGFSARGYDHEDILLAMAPRPVRVLAVTGDFFPIEGTRRTVARCRRFWELCGRADALDLVEDDSTHAFTPVLARAAAAFFARHLGDADYRADDGRIRPFAPSQLWCTRSGQVRGEIADAAFIPDANHERLREVEAERPGYDATVSWLRATVNGDRRACDLNPRFYAGDEAAVEHEELTARRCLWWSQEGIFGHGYAFRPAGRTGDTLPVTLAVWNGGTSRLAAHKEWIRAVCVAGRAALVLDVSGVGPLLPRPLSAADPHAFYGVLHKLATDLLFLNDDLVSLRTWDVLRALDMIAAWPGLDPSDITVYAHGRQGLYGRLAAALDARIGRLEVAEPGLDSFAEWVRAREYDADDIYGIVLPGVLRHFDLPDLPGPGYLPSRRADSIAG
jgi:cephalosporin-C deacetylase-like acetyl esterase